MITINFSIRNPWTDYFKPVWSHSIKTPFKNKFIEFELYKDSSIIVANFNWTTRQSHAGIEAEFGLLGHCFRTNLYDNRHWNYDKNCYCVYDGEF
jgi:hypothetical protein